MKYFVVLSVLAAAALVVRCSHTFAGTSMFRQLVFHSDVRYNGNMFSKRIEFFNYTLPATFGFGRTIQGILAYDLTNAASANITAGGVGYKFVSLRMKSPDRKDIKYNVYIYA